MTEAALVYDPSGTRWQQAAGVVQAQMAPGQTALLHLATARYHAMNEVGSRIWALLEHPQTLAALCTTLCDEYDIDAERCANEVAAYLASLHADQLVEPLP